jgi:hypothetical protein
VAHPWFRRGLDPELAGLNNRLILARAGLTAERLSSGCLNTAEARPLQPEGRCFPFPAGVCPSCRRLQNNMYDVARFSVTPKDAGTGGYQELVPVMVGQHMTMANSEPWQHCSSACCSCLGVPVPWSDTCKDVMAGAASHPFVPAWRVPHPDVRRTVSRYAGAGGRRCGCERREQ